MSEQKDDVEISEFSQTHIYAPDKEYQTHVSVVADVPDREHAPTRRGETRELVLTEGGNIAPKRELSADRPFAFQTDDEANVSRAMVSDAGVAIGYYVHRLECHAFSETEVWNQLERFATESGLELSQYHDFDERLNTRHRRMRLVDLLEFRIDEGDFAAQPYLDGDACGSWRSTNLSESGERFAESVAQSIEPNPRHCYRNAQQAAITHRDNHHVSYVEGIALPKQGAQVERHAWVEYDGEVVELTWPWHKYDADDAVYFGHQFDTDTVEHTFEHRGGSQLALSDSELDRLKHIRSGEN